MIIHSFYLLSFLFLETKHPQRLPMVVHFQLFFPLNVWWTDVVVWQLQMRWAVVWFVRRLRWVCRLVLTYMSGVFFWLTITFTVKKRGFLECQHLADTRFGPVQMHLVLWRDSCSRAIYSVFAARLILWAQAAFLLFHTHKNSFT